MKDFKDKNIVVTGAGSGLGRHFAIQLYQAGARLALCDIDLPGLSETISQIGENEDRISIHQVDVADKDQVDQFSADVQARYGPADLLINNAGICLIPQPFEEINEDTFKQVIDVNLWGAYHMIRAFLPQLRTRPEAGIVNISSLAGIVGLYGHSAYSMSKAGLRGLSETLQSELAGSQVHLTLVHPGGVRTNLIKNAPNLEEDLQDKAHNNFTQLSFLTSEKTVSRIIKAIQNKKNRAVIGFDARLILLIRALFPRKYPKMIALIFSQANFKDDPVWKTKNQ